MAIAFFGFSTEAIEVNVPSGSRVEIARCEGADVTGITGSVNVRSQDGSIRLRDVAVGSLVATTRDGRIDAAGLNLVGERPDAALHTDDGSIRVQLAHDANLTVEASTSDGRIVVDGDSTHADGSVQRTIRLGDGAGRMTVGTADGSIHINTNGAAQSD